jgi:metallo-beta-lactamase class B
MRGHVIGWLSAVGLAIGLSGANVIAQYQYEWDRQYGTVESHVAAAKAAAGQDLQMLLSLCEARRLPQPGQPPAPQREIPAEPSTWHHEPAKVFDNLYFAGTKSRHVWALTTSEGIILIESIADWSIPDTVAGMKKLGLDPTQIKYVVVSHAHADHYGGARYLQERFGARVIMSAMDWDLIDRSPEPKPKRELGLVVKDGQKLTLGDTTLTFYYMPGHTLGTISTLIYPLKDGGKRHIGAMMGGTGFNWQGPSRNDFMASREVGDRFWLETYINGVQRWRDIAEKAGAEVALANHTNFEATDAKLAALATRKPGDPHPYVLGKEGVKRYLTVPAECAKAGVARLNAGIKPS